MGSVPSHSHSTPAVLPDKMTPTATHFFNEVQAMKFNSDPDTLQQKTQETKQEVAKALASVENTKNVLAKYQLAMESMEKQLKQDSRRKRVVTEGVAEVKRVGNTLEMKPNRVGSKVMAGRNKPVKNSKSQRRVEGLHLVYGSSGNNQE